MFMIRSCIRIKVCMLMCVFGWVIKGRAQKEPSWRQIGAGGKLRKVIWGGLGGWERAWDCESGKRRAELESLKDKAGIFFLLLYVLLLNESLNNITF
jgi:hypothetical protein